MNFILTIITYIIVANVILLTIVITIIILANTVVTGMLCEYH